jgi:hypothetical protein
MTILTQGVKIGATAEVNPSRKNANTGNESISSDHEGDFMNLLCRPCGTCHTNSIIIEIMVKPCTVLMTAQIGYTIQSEVERMVTTMDTA